MKKMSVYGTFFVLLACLALAGCGGKETVVSENPMGLSGKRPAAAEAAFVKAHALWDKNNVCSNPSLALEWLDEAIRLDPEYAAAYLRRGLAKGDLRDWDGGFDDISKAIRRTPTAEAYAFRAMVSMRGGNLLGARKDIDKSLSIFKRQHLAWNISGMLHLLQGNREAACNDFTEGCDYGDCTGLDSAKARGECPK